MSLTLIVIGTMGSAAASTLGPVSAVSLFARNVLSPAVVPRMLMADAFLSGNFSTGRVPESRQYASNTWAVTSGSWSISSGSAQPPPGGTCAAIYDSGNANVLVAVTLTRQASSDAGLIVRSNASGTTYLLAEFGNTGSGSATLSRVVSGTSTTLARASKVGTLGVVPLSVEATGSKVVVRYNGTAVITYTLTAAETSTFGALTSTGIWVTRGAGESFDDFYVATWPPS
jgi:hypothetical protein